jgi:hypothetical protein
MAQQPGRIALALIALAACLPLNCGEDEPSDSSGASGRAADFDITGHWTGTLHQLGLGSFELDAEIRSLEDAAENPVSYTVIDCEGTWDYRGKQGQAFEFREVIDEGEGGDCKGQGTVTLTPSGANELAYAFSGDGVESRGTITRDR